MSANGGNGYVTGTTRMILRAEGLVVFLVATTAFFLDSGAWWLYLVLFLAPDLSFLAYAAGTKLGALAYNTLHAYILPLLLALVGWSLGTDWALHVALIWLAHIGIDRVLGYGLKYPTAFGHTHLGPIGKAKAEGLSMPS
jgi:hypothetical protein